MSPAPLSPEVSGQVKSHVYYQEWQRDKGVHKNPA